MEKFIEGEKHIKGSVRLPGDKSISHRAIMLSSIAMGESVISGLSLSSDVNATLDAMRKLGISIIGQGEKIMVEGVGITVFESRKDARVFEIDCRNSGTTVRLLAGLLGGAGIKATLTGDDSLKKRPMDRVVVPLKEAGVDITSTGGKLPVEIMGGRLHPFEYTLPVASAQVKSALILTALFINGTSVIYELQDTRDHTERMLLLMDGDIKQKNLIDKKSIIVTGRKELSPLNIEIPGDISSAVYFIAASLVTPGSEVTLHNVLLNRTRSYILDVLKRMGGRIEIEVTEELPEPRGIVKSGSSCLEGINIGSGEVPLLIDEIPALAAVAFFAKGETVVRGAEELRVKESDRIKGTVNMIKSFGGDVFELEDGFIIRGKNKPYAACVETYGDHRLAMASTILAINAGGKSRIKDAECVDVSFPGFFQSLDDLLVD